jgi:hypothetical protein
MNEIRQDDQCIERRGLMDDAHYYSVAEYRQGLRAGRMLSSSKARAFHRVIWTEGAPAVEKLTLDWQKTSEGSRFRICDWDVYDAQMREFLGLVSARP